MKKRLLIVEDEAITALDLKYSLEELGYEIVDTVDTGQDAINTAAETVPDIVLMDIKLKDMFYKPIDRDIKGVIKVGQADDENIICLVCLQRIGKLYGHPLCSAASCNIS